jgi:hypothetical protein
LHAESPLAVPASKRETIREGYPVKTILAAALILALGIAGISLWGAVHAQRMAVSSSQIFVHGTPVCVMQHAGEIIASVGMCGTSGGESLEDEPRLDLPPGHPPVDSIPAFEEGRRILI